MKTRENPKKTMTIYFEGVGRRKSAVSRVRLYKLDKGQTKVIEGKALNPGDIFVNSRLTSDYFPGEIYEQRLQEIFRTTNTLGKLAVSVKTLGSGTNSQFNAFLLGTARALVKFDPKLKPILRKKGYLTRDSRVRERRKVGTGGRARHKKQSPKR